MLLNLRMHVYSVIYYISYFLKCQGYNIESL